MIIAIAFMLSCCETVNDAMQSVVESGWSSVRYIEGRIIVNLFNYNH